MTSHEYKDALIKAVGDLEKNVQTRDILNAQIAGLRETVRVLSNRITLTKDERETISRLLEMVAYATPSLADSIRSLLLKVFPKALTAIEVRNSLEEAGFNFDDFSNELSACHAALKRMLSDEEVAIETTKDGKTAYKHVLKMTPLPTRESIYGNLTNLSLDNLNALAGFSGRTFDLGDIPPPPPVPKRGNK
jgi:SMC interacting uncharacterized protein involved in chromosome segregation